MVCLKIIFAIFAYTSMIAIAGGKYLDTVATISLESNCPLYTGAQSVSLGGLELASNGKVCYIGHSRSNIIYKFSISGKIISSIKVDSTVQAISIYDDTLYVVYNNILGKFNSKTLKLVSSSDVFKNCLPFYPKRIHIYKHFMYIFSPNYNLYYILNLNNNEVVLDNIEKKYSACYNCETLKPCPQIDDLNYYIFTQSEKFMVLGNSEDDWEDDYAKHTIYNKFSEKYFQVEAFYKSYITSEPVLFDNNKYVYLLYNNPSKIDTISICIGKIE